MNFLDSSEAVNAHEAAILKINGDATVRKPETGFSEASFSASAYNKRQMQSFL